MIRSAGSESADRPRAATVSHDRRGSLTRCPQFLRLARHSPDVTEQARQGPGQRHQAVAFSHAERRLGDAAGGVQFAAATQGRGEHDLGLHGVSRGAGGPGAADGPDGFRKFIGFLREKFPNSHSEIKRSFVDGDYVILHVHAVREPGTRGNAIIDIFKLEDGKIVEHWDVVQPIPENPANNNTMF